MIDIKSNENEKSGFSLSVKGPAPEIANQAISIALTMAQLFMHAADTDFGTFIQMLMAHKEQMAEINSHSFVFKSPDSNMARPYKDIDCTDDFEKIIKKSIAHDLRTREEFQSDDPALNAITHLVAASLAGDENGIEESRSMISEVIMKDVQDKLLKSMEESLEEEDE